MLKQLHNIAQKGDFNSFIPVAVIIFLGADPARVSQRRLANDIWNFSGQSERALHYQCLQLMIRLS